MATYQILIRDLTHNTDPVEIRQGLEWVVNAVPSENTDVKVLPSGEFLLHVDYLDDALSRLMQGVKDGLLPEAMVAVIVTCGNWWRPTPALITATGVKYGRLDLLDAAQADLLLWRKD